MELGGVTLRIDANDEQAFDALAAVDAAGAKSAATFNQKLTPAQKAFNREIAESVSMLSLMGRTADVADQAMVDSVRSAMAAQIAYAESVGASEKQLLQIAATMQQFERRVSANEQAQVRAAASAVAAKEREAKAAENTATRQAAAAQRAANAEARASQQRAQMQAREAATISFFGQQVVNAQGRVVGFGRSGLNALNAVSFGMTQLAATGQASFRSIATSAASVLSFFGTGGAITAALGVTALAIVDLFTKSRRQIEETRKKAADEARALQADLAKILNEGDLQGLAARERTIREGTPGGRDGRPFADALDTMQADAEKLGQTLQEIGNLQALSRVGDKSGAARLDTLLKSINNDVNAAQVERDQLAQEIAAKQRELAALSIARQRAAQQQLPGQKIEVKTPAKEEEERRQAIENEISALATIAKARQLSGAEIVRLAALERQLATELAATHPTKAREAEIWDQITRARQAAAKSLPDAQVRDPVSTRPQPTSTIEMSPELQAFLSPEAIQRARDESQKRINDAFRALDLQITTENLSQSLGNAIANGIASGFAVGLGEGGIGEGFKQLAAQLSSGLGSVAIDYGLKAIATAKFMAGIAKWLAENPLVALGLGVGLVALGKTFGGRSGGIGGGAGGGLGAGVGGDDTLRSFILGENASVPLNQITKSLRDTVQLLRNTTGTTRAPAWGPTDAQFLVVNTPAGQAFVANQVNDFNRDRRG